MYVIRERGLTTIEDEKRCLYYIPGGPLFWQSCAADADPPMDAAIRTLDEAQRLYATAAADHRARFHHEPTNLEIVGCQYHLI